MKQLLLKDYQTKADLLYSDFLQLQESIGEDLDLSNVDVDFLMLRMFKIFYNINPSDAKLLTDEQKELILGKLFDVLTQPRAELSTIINWKGIDYGLMNFDVMTAGELIDLDTLYLEKDLLSLTSIIYRPIISYNENGDYIIEEYKGFNNVFKDAGLNLIEGFSDWLNINLSEFKTGYPDIYKTNLNEDGEIEEEFEEYSEGISLGMSEKEAFVETYGPYMEFIYVITGGDLLRKGEVFKMNANDFMFSVDYLIKKNKIENMKK